MPLLLPIKTAVLGALSRKDEPPGVCPDCQREPDAGERDIRALTLEELLQEDSGRGDTLRDMSDMTRRMFGLPPFEHGISSSEDEESGSGKD